MILCPARNAPDGLETVSVEPPIKPDTTTASTGGLNWVFDENVMAPSEPLPNIGSAASTIFAAPGRRRTANTSGAINHKRARGVAPPATARTTLTSRFMLVLLGRDGAASYACAWSR